MTREEKIVVIAEILSSSRFERGLAELCELFSGTHGKSFDQSQLFPEWFFEDFGKGSFGFCPGCCFEESRKAFHLLPKPIWFVLVGEGLKDGLQNHCQLWGLRNESD